MIPDNIKGAIDRYVSHHIPPGGFTTAVLSNNLSEAIGRADEMSLIHIRDIVSYIYNEIPANIWGSEKKVQAWLEQRETE